MNLGRIFANAVARRVAYVLVAAAFAWLGIGNARAAINHPDQGSAYADCVAGAAYQVSTEPTRRKDPYCALEGTTTYREFFTHCSGNNHTGSCGLSLGNYHSFPAGKSCAARPDHVGSAPYSTQSGFPVQGAMSCRDGCVTAWYNNGDGTWTGDSTSNICTSDWLKENCAAAGTGYFWNAYAGLCQPPVPKCRADQTKDALTGECKDACPAGMVMDATGVCEQSQNECPAGNVRAPSGECLPGDGQCAAGEARRDNGTCGKDSDGDGIADVDDDDPDNDGKESASGGDTCDAPPQCNGGAIDCMQVKIQWRIDCNTRKNRNVSGGACNAPPVCTGDKCDAMEYASLMQQWRAACNLEKLLAGTGTGSNGQPDWTKVTGDGTEGAGAEPDGPVKDREFDPTNRLDDSGFFNGSGICPSFGVLELPFGATFDLDSKPWACDLFYMTRMFLLMLGTFIALGILMGWKT